MKAIIIHMYSKGVHTTIERYATEAQVKALQSIHGYYNVEVKGEMK